MIERIEIETESLEKVLKNEMRRLEKELHGAWRAGYDVVHIYRDVSNFHFNIYAYPAMKNDDLPETDSDCLYQFFYDLNAASDSEILAAVSK